MVASDDGVVETSRHRRPTWQWLFPAVKDLQIGIRYAAALLREPITSLTVGIIKIHHPRQTEMKTLYVGVLYVGDVRCFLLLRHRRRDSISASP